MQINSSRICPEKATAAISQLLSPGEINNKKLFALAIYSMHVIFMSESDRYSGKILSPLVWHTSPDARSKTLGDFEIRNSDGSCFEVVEVKHLKPISVGMIRAVYQKIKATSIKRYYILTTSEPDIDDIGAVEQAINRYHEAHPCEIIADGVIPSLRYYLRFVSDPQVFIAEYTHWLEHDYQRASGIKKKHLSAWQEIRKRLLKTN